MRCAPIGEIDVSSFDLWQTTSTMATRPSSTRVRCGSDHRRHSQPGRRSTRSSTRVSPVISSARPACAIATSAHPAPVRTDTTPVPVYRYRYRYRSTGPGTGAKVRMQLLLRLSCRLCSLSQLMCCCLPMARRCDRRHCRPRAQQHERPPHVRRRASCDEPTTTMYG